MFTIQVIESPENLVVPKILCIGSNYPDHIKEMSRRTVPINIPEPVVFMKPSSAIIHSGDTVIIPERCEEMHHEVELVAVISKTCKHIRPEQAGEYLLGYGLGLDMTMRDFQIQAKTGGKPWTLSKGFDTSAVVSDIIPAGKILNPDALDLKLWVNGELRQSGNTSQMLWRVPEIIAYLSRYFTLQRGDLIFTGTPAGVGEVRDGDTIRAVLDAWIEIIVTVKKEASQ